MIRNKESKAESLTDIEAKPRLCSCVRTTLPVSASSFAMLVPTNTNTRARCTGDDESALRPYLLTYLCRCFGAQLARFSLSIAASRLKYRGGACLEAALARAAPAAEPEVQPITADNYAAAALAAAANPHPPPA